MSIVYIVEELFDGEWSPYLPGSSLDYRAAHENRKALNNLQKTAWKEIRRKYRVKKYVRVKN